MPEWRPPTFMGKVSGFTVAFASWAKAGFPRRSAEWVAEIFNTHCKPCQWYEPDGHTLLGDKGKCGRCGRKLTVPSSIESGLGPHCKGIRETAMIS